MPSPFPGMNPYLERETAWSTFRIQFICTVQYHIVAQVRPRYTARLRTREFKHDVPPHRRHLDTAVVDKVTHVWIHDLKTAEVVTVIELLSPVNKYDGPHREQYLATRRDLLNSHANFVELDLLRGGPRMPPDTLPACDYCVRVSRAEKRPLTEVWPWRVREPMPIIPIPLTTPDSEARLDLKAVIDQVYDAGGYADYIYSGPPEPRLAPDDDAWAKGFLPARS